ncbi:hypothetical protein HDA32_005361 [Spinactinospora alkalitolerans]|uniref:AAA family ATPase n=1 Tax=Spinactinospora alkalitolerans TaxID=687207 RepID=A0A852U299_9ACTN|nr:AAA family ATPase [Spinactinospora alkalitolerans]NYE50241.1 hypothetical protein [Spinactinospora alkalitolerans]
MNKATRADLDAVGKFLTAYYLGAPGLLHIGSKEDFAGKTFATDPNGINAAVAYVGERDAAGSQGIYARPTTLAHELQPGKRGGAADSRSFLGFWTDLDYAGPGHKDDGLPPDEETAHKVYAEAGLPAPTILVNSGGGLYHHVLLDEPCDIADVQAREEIKRLSRRWHTRIKAAAERLGWSYGTGVSDLARVLRIPGTVNRKPGVGRVATAEYSGEIYSLDRLRELLDEESGAPAPAEQAPAASPTPSHGDGPFDVLSQEAAWANLLEPHGWTYVGSDRDGAELWLRPGDATSAHSARAGYKGIPTFNVHSTSAGLPTVEEHGGHPLTMGRLFAHLNHGGDEHAAARDLRWAALDDPRATAAARRLPSPVLTAIRQTCHTNSDQAAMIADILPPPANAADVHSANARAAVEESPGAPITDRLSALRALLIDSDGLDGIPDPEPIIDRVLYRDSLAWVHGKPGHGKSFVSLDWAGCVATGRTWQQHTISHPGTVVYLVAEGVTGVRQRVRAWEDAAGTRMDGVKFLPVAVQLLSHIDRDAFVRLVAELAPVLVVIDTQARVTVGADENSAQDMGKLVAAADTIREATGACVLLVHHEARAGDTLRGSTALEGAATTLIRITKDGPTVRVDCTKQKDAEPFPPILLRLVFHGAGAVLQSHSGVGLAEELAGAERKLLDVMRDSFGTTGATGTQLRDASEASKSSFYRALNGLLKKGLLRNTGTDKSPFYTLPEGAAPRVVPSSPNQSRETAGDQSQVPLSLESGTGGTGAGRHLDATSDLGPSRKCRKCGNAFRSAESPDYCHDCRYPNRGAAA